MAEELTAVAGGNALDTMYGTFVDEWCGTAQTAWVPDMPFGYDFRMACREHDACFASAIESFADCNASFRQDLSDACGGALSCEFLAFVYHQAVELFGDSAYGSSGSWHSDDSSRLLQDTGWAY